MKRFKMRYFFVSEDNPNDVYCISKIEYATSKTKALEQFPLEFFSDLKEIKDIFLNWTATQE